MTTQVLDKNQVMDSRDKYSKYLPLAGAGAVTIAMASQPVQASGSSDPLTDVTGTISSVSTGIAGVGAIVVAGALVYGATKVVSRMRKG
ncbi:hypothetical protein WEU38_11880 [Cyanobacterium aponinum AL20118]|uniref:Uncharacterized protein n=1 Tax=Cyanobacterium aponinum AL20115 TaxID=3090662 RepID=A0AAF0ZAN8_9CHRO|nr:hypothetical protein [Cyanobacterium aponinum]WPF87509.1 hypothetical protein SAY89_11910 [Cyanobacterium aponinum AL20115]